MLSKIKNLARHRINRRKVSSIGQNTLLYGNIEKRALDSLVDIGCSCLIEGTIVTETNSSQIKIGNNVFIGGGSMIDCVDMITIEDDVLISYECMFADSNNHSVNYSLRKKDLEDWKSGGKHDWSTTVTKPIRISKGAWVGARSIILKGVLIGEGAVIGAGSVVTNDIPAWTIAAGNPAKIIRKIAVDER